MIETKNKTIVISKINQIGDVIMTLPIASELKQNEKTVKIYFLGRASVCRALVEQYQDVDKFIDWEELDQLSENDAVNFLKEQNIDIFLHISTNSKLAKLVKKAKIPTRIGTSHRLYHLLTCNTWVNIGRKNSELHETELDMQHIKMLSGKKQYTQDEIIKLRNFKVFDKYFPILDQLSKEKFNLILHPKTRGEHIEYSPSLYRKLINKLDKSKFNIFVTGSKKEGDMIYDDMIAPFEHVHDLTGKTSLEQLMHLIAHTDGLIASSTGPVHLAAAFGINTLGLYAPIKPFHSGRWGPVGQRASTLTVDKDCNACRDGSKCRCVNEIKIDDIYWKIMSWEKLS